MSTTAPQSHEPSPWHTSRYTNAVRSGRGPLFLRRTDRRLMLDVRPHRPRCRCQSGGHGRYPSPPSQGARGGPEGHRAMGPHGRSFTALRSAVGVPDPLKSSRRKRGNGQPWPAASLPSQAAPWHPPHRHGLRTAWLASSRSRGSCSYPGHAQYTSAIFPFAYLHSSLAPASRGYGGLLGPAARNGTPWSAGAMQISRPRAAARFRRASAGLEPLRRQLLLRGRDPSAFPSAGPITSPVGMSTLSGSAFGMLATIQ